MDVKETIIKDVKELSSEFVLEIGSSMGVVEYDASLANFLT